MKQVVINPLSNQCVDCFTSLGKFGKFQEILMNVLNMWPSDLFKRDSSILDNYYNFFAVCDRSLFILNEFLTIFKVSKWAYSNMCIA